jgi:hypothetical protein
LINQFFSKVEQSRVMQGKKTGGRIAGTPNKITIELRKTLKEVIAKELESLPGRLEELSGKERLELLIKLMPFALPKVDSINGQYDTGWRQLDDE